MRLLDRLAGALKNLLTERGRREGGLGVVGGGGPTLLRTRLVTLEDDERLHALELLVLPPDVLEEGHVARGQALGICRHSGRNPGATCTHVVLVLCTCWLHRGVALLLLVLLGECPAVHVHVLSLYRTWHAAG